MKTLAFILPFLFFVSTSLPAQSDKSISGPVKEVKPHFGGQQTLVVDSTELVLISDPKDASGNTFEINSEFKDLLIKRNAVFVLNPKYRDKILKFNYYINGKGWKCISAVSEVKLKGKKIKSAAPAK